MKRLCILSAALLLLTGILLPAGDRSRGVYTPYDFDAPRKDVPAPKGFKTFYLTHYGRHGARYINRENEYEAVEKVLCHAALTPEGVRIRQQFEALYPSLKGRATDLTPQGQEQHFRLGQRMVSTYPALFRKGCSVEAYSSDIPRCILSMGHFADGLRAGGSKAAFQPLVSTPMVRVLKNHALYKVKWDSALVTRFDTAAFYRRLFVDPAAARKLERPEMFVQSLYYFGVHLEGALSKRYPSVEDVFTEEEAAVMSSLEDQKFHHNCGWGNPRNVARVWPLLDDFIRRADADIKAGAPTVRLRFGHDITLIPLMTMLEMGPFDASRFDSGIVTMACNTRWVFARNKADSVIVKVQYNESDVSPWMAWSRFREDCLQKIDWARRCLSRPVTVHTVRDANTPATPLFSAHRGLQPFGPENSFATFEAAVREGMWAIETDFRMTADSVVVCMHDATLERTTDGKGKVRDHTLEELRGLQIQQVNTKTAVAARRYDYSALTRRQKSIPTMDDYFRACRRGGCVAFVDLNEDGGIIKRMIQSIEKYGLQGRTVISTGKMDIIRAYRAAGGKELVHLYFAKPEQIPELVSLAPAAIAFNFPKLDEQPGWVLDGKKINTLKELVDYCHSLGLKICFRAVDTPESAKKSLELGIDYLPTNTLWKY